MTAWWTALLVYMWEVQGSNTDFFRGLPQSSVKTRSLSQFKVSDFRLPRSSGLLRSE